MNPVSLYKVGYCHFYAYHEDKKDIVYEYNDHYISGNSDIMPHSSLWSDIKPHLYIIKCSGCGSNSIEYRGHDYYVCLDLNCFRGSSGIPYKVYPRWRWKSATV